MSNYYFLRFVFFTILPNQYKKTQCAEESTFTLFIVEVPMKVIRSVFLMVYKNTSYHKKSLILNFCWCFEPSFIGVNAFDQMHPLFANGRAKHINR